MLSYLYKKYLDWSDFYRNREPNQYGTTLYPRTLDGLRPNQSIADPLPIYPAVVAVAAEPQCENTIDLRRKTYKEALVNNLKKI